MPSKSPKDIIDVIDKLSPFEKVMMSEGFTIDKATKELLKEANDSGVFEGIDIRSYIINVIKPKHSKERRLK